MPGRSVTVELEVTNDLEVIDGVSVEVRPEKGLSWSASPQLLPLFPEGTGVIVLQLEAAPTYLAGRHEVTIELRSSVEPAASRTERLVLFVPELSDGTVSLQPSVRSGRREARYEVRFENTGNTSLEVAFAATDPLRAAKATFMSPRLPVSPGSSTATTMRVLTRRQIFGGELSHQLTVLATAGELEREVKAIFRQRPVVPRGARTVAVLAAIVALWAAIFAVVLNRALSKDPLTKQVPASFYASLPRAKLASSASGALGGSSSTRAPAGAVPKSGVVIGVGGAISGRVVAKSTGEGVGRINVEALEEGPKGLVPVASAATASNGTYEIDGLLPGAYALRFEAQGFRSLYYPDGSTPAQAKAVSVDALATTSGIDAVLVGLPGEITGIVETGEHPSPPVSVTVVPSQGVATTPVATTTTNRSGLYHITGLPTPQTYDLSFSAKGFEVASSTDVLGGGQALIADNVTLNAASGSISGVVTGGGEPLGGVSIQAEGDGSALTSATPTTGAIGQFALVGLASPATYLLTFSKAGYGTRILGIKLGPGQDLSGLRVALQGGAGEISGSVASASGVPLGGVAVTVQGMGTSAVTESLTAGTIGAYDLSGLSTPGRYTLTFSLPGYVSQTVAVALASSGSAHGVDVRLSPDVGTITGRVTSAKGALSGVQVSATNGTTVTTTTSTSQPAGGFLLSGLAPGSYAVTFSMPGYAPATYLVQLEAGSTRTVDATLSATG
jgi:hypothetical protein